MENVGKHSNKRFSVCLLLLLTATLLINLLSSYIRHVEAGLGCDEWPDCYGRVGAPIAPAQGDALAALTPTETAKRAHRTIATVLVGLVLWAVYQARQLPLRGTAQFLPYLLLGVIVLLSVIGPASYLKTSPAIASVNMLGGMALLALTWLLWLEMAPPRESVAALNLWATVALAVLLVQIALGTWVSANFAGAACSGLLACQQHEGDSNVWSSFWYFRELDLDGSGRIMMDSTQVVIHQLHQLGAAVTTIVLVGFSALAIRASGLMARWGVALLGVLTVQLVLGLAALTQGLPLFVVLAHNIVASLLLLCVLRMKLLARVPSPSNPVRTA
jgi:cytochrome c oxidase assembly protein subunit 15